MATGLLIIGLIWFLWNLLEEASWHTNAYNGREFDIDKSFHDACVKRISKSEYKANYKSGKYIK